MISWTDRVRSEKKNHIDSRRRGMSYIQQYLERKLTGLVGHILHKSCLLKDGAEGKIQGKAEMTRMRGRKRKQPLDNIKEKTGY